MTNLPSLLSLSSAVVGLFMGVFALRLSRAPRWAHMVWYSGAAFCAAGFSFANVAMSISAVPLSVIVWLERTGLALAGIHGACWLVFFTRWAGRPLTRIERVRIVIGLGAAVLCLIPGAALGDHVEIRQLGWLGIAYADPVPGPLAGPIYAVYLVSLVLVGRSALQAVNRHEGGGLRGIAIGFGVTFACATNDVLSSLRILETPYILDIGLFALVAGIGASITTLFIESARKLETYSVELERAQRDLVERERLAALGELAAVVAHEVRNPLGVLFNVLATLRRTTPLPDTSKPLLSMAEEEAERLKRLVAALLDFARPYTLSRERHGLSEVVAEAVTLACAASGQDEKTAIAVEADPSLTVDCDRLLLSQAVSNLVTNALQGDGRDRPVRIVATAEDDGFARLSVIDDGRGVDDDAVARIFQPFFTTRPTGTGLGLALVKRIVEAHGGTIDYAPTPGGGATFIVRIPRFAESGSQPSRRERAA